MTSESEKSAKSHRSPVLLHVQLARTNQASVMAFERMTGVHPRRWQISDFLMKNGPSTQKALAEAMYISPGVLSRVLKEVEALGLVERRSNHRDNRLTDVTLTKLGRSQYKRIAKNRDAFIAQAMKGISDQQAAPVIDVLRTIERNVSEGESRSYPYDLSL